MPRLYLVGTPIGNLEDISLRALRILGEVALIAAEDTRKTGRLLKQYDIDTALTSFHEHSRSEKIDKIIGELEEKDVALVSDAGMPGLSDPGYRLVRAAIEAGVKVEPIPGPSAGVTALVSSGLPSDRYLFLGFLPRQTEARRQSLKELSFGPYTMIFYEAPHRLADFLNDGLEILGDRQICVAREMTKLHEEIWRGNFSEASNYFGERAVKGELTILVSGRSEESPQWDEEMVRKALQDEMRRGSSKREAAALVAEDSGWRKRDLYRIALDLD